jgi:hypothetical protein
MEAVAWTAIGLLAATLFGNMCYLGSRIDNLSNRVDNLGTRLDARLDALSSRLDAHMERHAS